jgi:hypothetical protein
MHVHEGGDETKHCSEHSEVVADAQPIGGSWTVLQEAPQAERLSSFFNHGMDAIHHAGAALRQACQRKEAKEK